MRIVPISDTHNNKPTLPEGDLLIHAGDLTVLGSEQEVKDAAAWLKEISPRYTHGVVLVPGNHDFLFEESLPNLLNEKRGKRIVRNAPLARKIMEDAGIKLLINQSTEINNVKIYGSPTSLWFNDWAFNVRPSEMAKEWENIPDNTEILITHGPPYGIGDLTKRGGHVGCQALVYRLKTLNNLKMHIFGHIHEGAGTSFFNNKLMVNASVLDVWYNGFNNINVVEFPSLNVRSYPDESV